MFEPKVKIRKDLYEKLRKVSEFAGGSSVEEFVEKVLEREVDAILANTEGKELSKADVEEIANKLKGLGYID
jgi:predicted CopG family antitoxin